METSSCKTVSMCMLHKRTNNQQRKRTIGAKTVKATTLSIATNSLICHTRKEQTNREDDPSTFILITLPTILFSMGVQLCIYKQLGVSFLHRQMTGTSATEMYSDQVTP